MSELTVQVTNCDERGGLPAAPEPQAFWNDASLLPVRGTTLALTAHRGPQLLAYWLVPIDTQSDIRAARRPCRLFPYCSPWLRPTDTARRRRIFTALIATLQKHVALIDLPLAPDFRDANAAVAQGCFAEWRHTNVITRSRWEAHQESAFSTTAVAHARRAARYCHVETLSDFTAFKFDRAIHGSDLAVVWRSTFANALWAVGKAFMLVARDSRRQQVGGAFVAFDSSTAFLYHLWGDRRRSGVSALLVREAVRTAFQRTTVELFDFEGSILAGVDDFMSNFGTAIVPYAHLYWAPDDDTLCALLRESFKIPGRTSASAP